MIVRTQEYQYSSCKDSPCEDYKKGLATNIGSFPRGTYFEPQKKGCLFNNYSTSARWI